MKIFKVLLFFLALSSATATAFSQNANPNYSIYLHNKTLHGNIADTSAYMNVDDLDITQFDLSMFSANELLMDSAEYATFEFEHRLKLSYDRFWKFQEYTLANFVIVQFAEIPSPESRRILEANGIQLLDYIPNYAYIASCHEFMNISTLQTAIENMKLKTTGIFPILPEYKIRQSLNELPLPAWAIKETGTIDVVVSYYSNVEPAFARTAFLELGFTPFDFQDYGHYFSVRISQDKIRQVAELEFVSFVEPVSPSPQPENYTGRTLHRDNCLAQDYVSGRHYDGTGVVVALGDDGIIGPHIDYTGRVDNSRVTNNDGDHGDHVGGTIMGAGNLNPRNKGMAFGASLEVYDVWDAINESPSDHISDSVMITSTSYSDGCNAGYTSFARFADLSTRQNPTLIHVFSAGNDGASDCGYGAGAGWGNITGGVKVGKNVITVGNVNGNDNLDGSSSRGPAPDGRIKPEVCAKGVDVVSTMDVNSYQTLTGTSMSCPGVSGTVAELYHAYRSLNGGVDPQSALIKALLMNTCDDIGNIGPDFKNGFGRINSRRAVECMEQNLWFNDSIAQAESDTFFLNVPTGLAEIKIMTYWHDHEAANMASPALVNNLDMKVKDPLGNIFDPWMLNPTPNVAALNALATRGVDNLNNQEQFTLDAPPAGVYTIIVNGTVIPQGPQKYFIVYEMLDSNITVTWPIGGEPLVPGETEKIRWDAAGLGGTFDVEYSLDSGSTWLSIVTGINGGFRQQNWSVPTTVTSKALVKVTRGNFSDVSDTTFNVLRVPTNVNVSSSCMTYCTLEWDSVPDADFYEISMLGNKYMDSIGTTTSNTFQVNGISPTQTYWFSVKAMLNDGGTGRRAIAIEKAPGIWNCQEPNDCAVNAVIVPGTGLISECNTSSSMNIKVELMSYSPNAMTNIPVKYKINSNPIVTETFTDTLPPYGTAEFTFSVSENFSGPATYTISSWTSFGADVNNLNDTLVSISDFIPGTTVSTPFSDDFETFVFCNTTSNCGVTVCALTNGWVNPSNTNVDDIDWRPHAGPVPSTGTGPIVDHKPGTSIGKFIYLESSACLDKEAQLVSPCINLTGLDLPELSFWFSLNGDGMGELHLDIYSDDHWQNDITGVIESDWGAPWWNRKVNLSAWAGKTVVLRWRGITGTTYTSDMALDDIGVYDALIANDNIFDGKLSVFPNPSEGIYQLQAYELPADELKYQIVDLTGRVVKSEVLPVNGKNLNSSIDLSSQPSGVYNLIITSGNLTGNMKLVLQR